MAIGAKTYTNIYVVYTPTNALFINLVKSLILHCTQHTCHSTTCCHITKYI